MYLEMNPKSLSVPLLLLFSFSIVFTKYDEDTPCHLPDGTEGVCFGLEHCVEGGPEGNPMRKIVYPQFCSMDVFVPTLCCKDCQPVENSSVTETRLWKPGGGVVGGVDPERYAYRHMALLGYGSHPRNADWLCGGSLISDYFILTAAHCITNPTSGKVKFAALGVLKRTDDFNMWQIHDIANIVPYPDYASPSKYDDIALLATRYKIRYNNEVAPACVFKGYEMPAVATATDWGTLGSRQALADNLKVVRLKKLSDQDCKKQFTKHKDLQKGYDKLTQACYDDDNKIGDMCEGDSGGPLQIMTERFKKSKCEHTIVGITSFGRNCGVRGTPAMYTRVSHYVPWIESFAGRLP